MLEEEYRTNAILRKRSSPNLSTPPTSNNNRKKENEANNSVLHVPKKGDERRRSANSIPNEKENGNEKERRKSANSIPKEKEKEKEIQVVQVQVQAPPKQPKKTAELNISIDSTKIKSTRFAVDYHETSHSPKPPPRRKRGITDPPPPTSPPQSPSGSNMEQRAASCMGLSPTANHSNTSQYINDLLNQKKDLSSPTFESSGDSVVSRLTKRYESGDISPLRKSRDSRSNLNRQQTGSGRFNDLHDVSGWNAVAALEKDIELLFDDRANLISAVLSAIENIKQGDASAAQQILANVPICAPNSVQQRAKKIETSTIRMSGHIPKL